MEKYVRFFEPQVNYKLLETLYSIQKDVDYIYDVCFSSFVDDYNNNRLKDLDRYIISHDNDFNFLSSYDLKTSLCKKANETNPISIFCGIYKSGSFFDFGVNRLQITLNIDVIKFIYDNHISGKKDLESRINIKKAKFRMMAGEISITKIKATIAHELAHWIDESRYSVMSKIVDGEKDPEKRKQLLSLGYEDVDMTYFEIQAQIHGIKQLKSRHRKYWDTYPLEKVFELYPVLYTIANKLDVRYGTDTLKIWIHFLVRRMNREKLLGKNMRLPIKIENIFIEDYTRV